MNIGDQLQRLMVFPNIIRVSSCPWDRINFLRELESLQSVFLTFITVSTSKSGPCGSIFVYNLPSDRLLSGTAVSTAKLAFLKIFLNVNDTKEWNQTNNTLFF
jgi:hypothetical protein